MFTTLVLSTLLVASVSSLHTQVYGRSDESEYAKDCRDIQKRGNTTSGVYVIKPDFYSKPVEVYCDMDSEGGGWIRILNRVDGSQDFSLSWKCYKGGFGDLNGEFWWGLEYIHQFTVNEVNELLVQLVDWDSVVYNMHYSQFNVSGEGSGYALQLNMSSYIGPIGDSLSYHVGQKFSTIDRDNSDKTCTSADGGGGWWYYSCYQSQLTGRYLPEEEATKGKGVGICWMGYQESYPCAPKYYSFKEARMMIKTISTT